MLTSTLRGRRCGRRLASVTLALALTGGVVAAAPGAAAQANPFQRGPNPTNASIEAFATSTTNTSSVRTRIDASRLGVMGHSMGGGGTLAAARNNTALQAAVPLMPWDQTKSFPGIQIPTLIIGSQNDSVAPVANHSIPFFNSIPAASEKAYLELAGASHTAANSPNTTLAKFAISWLKRFVDNDTRYEQFICPAPSGSAISQYRDTCPG